MFPTSIRLALLALLFTGTVKAQDDLLGLLGQEKPKKERIKYAFKSPRVINSHSEYLVFI